MSSEQREKVFNTSAREAVKALYLEYYNDFLTVDRFAEHHDLAGDEALILVQMGKLFHLEDTLTH